MDIKKLIETIAEHEDEFKLVVNIGGMVLVLGQEVAKILESKGMMTQIEYLEVIKSTDDRDAVARAKLQKFIDG